MPWPGDEPTGLRHDRRTVTDPSEQEQLAAARRTLALLQAQAEAVRADLASLRRETEKAKQELSGLRTAQLLEVNDRLVQAAVQADTAAQTAVSSLDELTRVDPARRADRRHRPGR